MFFNIKQRKWETQMSNNNRKFIQKIVLAVIAIIPSILTLFIGYNQGQISTRIDTLERLDGIQKSNRIFDYLFISS